MSETLLKHSCKNIIKCDVCGKRLSSHSDDYDAVSHTEGHYNFEEATYCIECWKKKRNRSR